MYSQLILPFEETHAEYLRDESRRAGVADSISFPRSEVEVAEILRACSAEGTAVTVQGGRTGIAAGAVPEGGHVLNLSRMQGITGLGRSGNGETWCLRVEPGLPLSELRLALEHLRFPESAWDEESRRNLEVVRRVGAEGPALWFAPDPTETSASIGGMAACNASGALTFRYGATRNHIESLRMVLADGEVVSLRRGETVASGRAFSLTTEGGRVIAGDLPAYSVPAVKSAAGYQVAEDLDLVDLFLGMEGTLGVITELGLRLQPRPEARIGMVVFLPTEDATLSLVRRLREGALEVTPVAMEFFNARTLDLLRAARAEGSAFGSLPDLPDRLHTALYLEFHGEDAHMLEGQVLALEPILEELGGSSDDTWYGENKRHIQVLKEFRHAPPESVNLQIDRNRATCPGLTKLGTDMSVRDEDLEWVMALYNGDLREAGLDYVIFGHIGNSHVHVNIIPRSMEEYDRGKALYLSWAKQIVARGGSVSAEHGIGKLKVPFLELMVGGEGISEMRRLKACFDPQGLLSQGNLFEVEER
ncbi:MAG: FAD-binding oxidoreductase [Planctomycetota bacterium]|jgi:D-lactate dehydrogenase (cytochrome)